MVNLKKYRLLHHYFVLFLTLSVLFSCQSRKVYVDRIHGSQTKITTALPNVSAIDSFIQPYRSQIDADLDMVLAYAPVTLDKFTGTWQTSIGNLMADEMLRLGNKHYQQIHTGAIDICLLNHGGIRAPISKGNVTKRTAFEVMPFENSLIVLTLKTEQIREMAQYIISEKKPHPLSGMTFSINNEMKATDIAVQGQPIQEGRTYTVVTSDYLANGGDNMTFFGKATSSADLNYKIRDALIDFFTEADTITASPEPRITIIR